ncbi:MAG: GNAT family N-acetyltransferase [Glutamicibacter sp.]|uniref:GNAT family N-acetyltransferase n=3 Tax=Glutamicibacter sp. TaxID=1931995 RepID=UPI002FC97835
MTLSIEPADFEDPSLRAFLEAHLADMAPQSPLESQHALDLAALRQPTVRLWTAQKDQRIVGTCALAVLEPGHEELKSMRTDPDFRGQGVASRLLFHALEDAAQRKLSRISLETGAMEFFAPARSLYRKHGFQQCQPFGSYLEDPNSIYMTRILELN